ncbi:MAG TPA: PadR family transcriptional regulator [Actinoplanes sp.]|jgi:PadR family transcriptional regulator PadR
MIEADSGGRDGRSTQLLRGVLDLCLLSVIAERPRYGYELVESLAEQGLALVSEGSIYPLLARLEGARHVESFKQPSANGPARKYYRLTATGAAELDAGRRAWAGFAQSVSRVLTSQASPPDPTTTRIEEFS